MLEGILRESIDRKSLKTLRRDGYLIANIYAKGFKNIHAAFKENEFIKAVRKKEGLVFPVKVGEEIYNVVIQEYQKEPVTNRLIHVDLKVALPNIVTKYMVPVVIKGIAKGVKDKGVLVISKRRLGVKSTAENLPDAFELDVSDLDVGDSLLVRDIKVNDNIKIIEADRIAVVGVIKAQ
ncbi:MAG: 50S ribosomal protein L25/general stress protein Ctc [Campylobacteraceae bacterium]|jgi:large subunit ribosomal protein L25|nr:50S ribosomal protein L25/general stress protein Ctc [Campylobacteraceae bacterium]